MSPGQIPSCVAARGSSCDCAAGLLRELRPHVSRSNLGFRKARAKCVKHAVYMYPRSKRPRKGERSVAVERPAPADVERAEEAPLIQHPAALLPAPPTTLPRTAVPGGPSPTQAAPLIPRTAVAAPTVYTTAQGSPVSTSYVSYVRGGMPAPTGVRFGVPPAPAAASNTVSHGAQAGTAGPAEQAAAASTMALFDALDANGDGVLDAAELAQLKMGGPPPARSALPSEPVASVTRFPPVFALAATGHATCICWGTWSISADQARSSEHLELSCFRSYCMWQHGAQFKRSISTETWLNRAISDFLRQAKQVL